MVQRDLNQEAFDAAYRQQQFVVRTNQFGWEESVIRVLLDGASITVVHNNGIRVILQGSEFVRVKNIWSVARRRLAQYGIKTRTLEQLLLHQLCARA